MNYKRFNNKLTTIIKVEKNQKTLKNRMATYYVEPSKENETPFSQTLTKEEIVEHIKARMILVETSVKPEKLVLITDIFNYLSLPQVQDFLSHYQHLRLALKNKCAEFYNTLEDGDCRTMYPSESTDLTKAMNKLEERIRTVE